MKDIEILYKFTESHWGLNSSIRGILRKAAHALNSRAGKLLLQGEPFFVIKASEPYARQVVELIKKHEGDNWSEVDDVWANSVLTIESTEENKDK